MDLTGNGTDRLTELRTSARGWHGVQLAVLGFIGLCGVLQSGAGADNPRWLQVLAGLLALTLSCVATALVASAAWPVYGSSPTAPGPGADENGEIRRTGRRLRTGITMTFLAVVVVALAATSSWWPREVVTPGGFVEVSTGNAVLCGQLRQAEPGVLGVEVDGRPVQLALSDVVQLRPLDTCT